MMEVTLEARQLGPLKRSHPRVVEQRVNFFCAVGSEDILPKGNVMTTLPNAKHAKRQSKESRSLVDGDEDAVRIRPSLRPRSSWVILVC